jgi:hypothetical protein
VHCQRPHRTLSLRISASVALCEGSGAQATSGSQHMVAHTLHLCRRGIARSAADQAVPGRRFVSALSFRRVRRSNSRLQRIRLLHSSQGEGFVRATHWTGFVSVVGCAVCPLTSAPTQRPAARLPAGVDQRTSPPLVVSGCVERLTRRPRRLLGHLLGSHGFRGVGKRVHSSGAIGALCAVLRRTRAI